MVIVIFLFVIFLFGFLVSFFFSFFLFSPFFFLVFQRGLSIVQWGIYRGDSSAVQFLVSYGASPGLNVRTLWFPEGLTLKEVIYKQFSEDIYDEIDLAIYRGGKQQMEREAKKKIIASTQWETAPSFDAYSMDATPQTQTRSFPQNVVNMISSYEM